MPAQPAILPQAAIGVATGAGRPAVQALEKGLTKRLEAAAATAVATAVAVHPVRLAEDGRRPADTIQAGPRRRQDRRPAVPPGVWPKPGIGAPLLPVAAANELASAAKPDGREAPAPVAAELTPAPMELEATDLAKPIPAVVLPRPTKVLLGLADVLRAAALAGPATP